LSYNRGPLALAAGYLRLDGVGQANNFGTASTGQFGFSAVTSGYESARAIQMAALAANYTFGNMRVGAQYTNVKYLPGSQSLFTNTEVFNTYGTFATYRFTPTFDVAAGYSYTVASKANGIEDSAKYQQVSLKQAYHLSKRTTIYTLQAYQHASGQTLGTAGIGDIVNATPDVGDAESSTPSSTSGQFVAIVGLNVTF
jgi:predicted porin